jgi:hypothetical protein
LRRFRRFRNEQEEGEEHEEHEEYEEHEEHGEHEEHDFQEENLADPPPDWDNRVIWEELDDGGDGGEMNDFRGVIESLSNTKGFHATTPTEMAEILATFPDVRDVELPKMRDGFHKFGLENRITQSLRLALLQYFEDNVRSCKHCEVKMGGNG